ncbi:hypothetical protein M5K25_026018 [Dendrobium thyrsiflorum]|uniref:Uncharacterized protein n=1 Tax=Dendrobium thyrsiflorum TaxID=117978 RepID=A0ABD0TW74_DENTH
MDVILSIRYKVNSESAEELNLLEGTLKNKRTNTSLKLQRDIIFIINASSYYNSNIYKLAIETSRKHDVPDHTLLASEELNSVEAHYRERETTYLACEARRKTKNAIHLSAMKFSSK